MTRPSVTRSFLLLLLVLGFPLPVPAGDPPVKVHCERCGDKGWIPCDKHKKKFYELEAVGPAVFCSETAGCPKCGGILAIDCPDCDKDVSAELERKRAEYAAWLEKMRAIDQAVKARGVMHCTSKHFILTYNLKSISPERRALKTHGGMHLYLARLEAFFQDFLKDVGAEEKDMLAKTHVMIWQRQHELVRAAAKYCHQDSNTKSYLLGAAPLFTLFYDKGFLHEEYELHQAVLHGVAHCLLSNVWDGIWPGTIKGAWIACGYAHFVELRYFTKYGGGVRNYFYREGDQNADFRFGKWAATVRKEVGGKKNPSFLEVTSKNIDQLDRRDHMYAWSYVDFILKKHPEAFGKVARLVKSRRSVTEALREALGMTPFGFEEAWKVYVMENYSLKDPDSVQVSRRRRR